MRVIALTVALALTPAVSLASCATPAILTPSDGMDPCGHYEHSCGDGTCCGNDEACGGGTFSGCPAGACCAADSVRRPHAARRLL